MVPLFYSGKPSDQCATNHWRCRCGNGAVSMVDMTEGMSLRQVAPDVPHRGGSHEPEMPNMSDVTDEVLRANPLTMPRSMYLS